MKTMITIAMAGLLLIAGCGVDKEYVNQQVTESESRMDSKLQEVEQQTTENTNQLQQLQSLAQQLQSDVDMAINEAKGFENYQIIWQGEINFAFDSYEIDDVAKQILDEAGAKMRDYPGSVVELSGHTDRTGSNRYNMMLGEMRSQSAKRYLTQNHGIALYRMFTATHGETKPVAMPDEQNAHQKNRRVELTVWGNLQGSEGGS